MCENCEFISLDECLILAPDEEKRRYELHNNTFENKGYVDMFLSFIDSAILPHKDHVSSALDFGCGTTPVLATLLKEHIEYVDHYDPYFYPHEEVFKKKYDLITTTEVIEHLKSPLMQLSELVSRLNPHGILAIMTRFHPGNDIEFLKWWYIRDETHISFYTVNTLRVIANAIGGVLLSNDNVKYCVMKKKG
ncbi:MAG: class I SAM-dependent methyltransferase [Candidatus Omnitrophica bacterium]|nr:class I SAM-dependent methyltransferase [Candidatus Omnitrophota bacterium]